jgi:hypothetical protein
VRYYLRVHGRTPGDEPTTGLMTGVQVGETPHTVRVWRLGNMGAGGLARSTVVDVSPRTHASGAIWQRAWFGSTRLQVQILSGIPGVEMTVSRGMRLAS